MVDFPSAASSPLQVSASEAGQKLLSFLRRRIGAPPTMIRRWIRSGQVRLNGHRTSPQAPVAEGDAIRLPPFAQAMRREEERTPDRPMPPLLGQVDGILAFNKPSHLPTQGGTGHSDSVASRLAAHYAHLHAPFIPAPAHRLDRDTTGILLAGASYQALSTLHHWFREGQIHKEYLAWVVGHWHGGARLLRHWLKGKDRVEAHASAVPNGRLALSTVSPLRRVEGYTLLHIRLITGGKRQIRAQMAAMGLPLVGDARYGQPAQEDLKLHCARIILPTGHEFVCLPPWDGKFRVDSLPPLLNNELTRTALASVEGE